MPILSTLGAVFSNASLSFILALPLVIVSVVPVLFVATVTKAIAGKGAAISFLSLCTAAIPWGPRGGLRTTDLARFDEVFKLPPGDHLPEHFRGVWFMEGNPQPDDLACLHNAQWDPVARRLTLYLTGEDGWTWHDSYDGRKKVFITALIGMNYVFEWDEISSASFLPPRARKALENCEIFPYAFGIQLPLKALGRFYMHKIKDGWDRRTVGADGSESHYYLRRLIDGNGVVIHDTKARMLELASNASYPSTQLNQVFGTGRA